MSKSITRGAVAAAFLISTTFASGAQDETPDPVPAWGAANSIYSLGACDAGSRDATHTYQATNCVLVETVAGGSASVGFPVHLPTGAVVTSIKLNYFDGTLQTNPTVSFRRTDATGTQLTITTFSFPLASPGNATMTLPVNHTINNLGFSYVLLATVTRDVGGSTGVYGFEITYHLQVSPAPATATFPNDVPTNHPFFRFIEAMAASGLTGGCGAGTFCPDSPVTRGQMAVFLAVALGLNFPN